MMSLAHPLSTGSASKLKRYFNGELFFCCGWFFFVSVLCHVNYASIDMR